MHLPKLSQKGYRRITSPSPGILSTCLTTLKQLTRLSRALHDIHDIHVYKYSTVTCYYQGCKSGTMKISEIIQEVFLKI